MINLNTWFYKYSIRPILLLVSALIFLASGIFLFNFHNSQKTTNSSVQLFQKNLNLALIQKNGPQVEAILTTLSKLDGVNEAVLCSKGSLAFGKGYITNICNPNAKYLKNTFIIPGSEDLQLVLQYKNPFLEPSFIFLMGLFITSLVGSFLTLKRFKEHFERDLLSYVKNLGGHDQENGIFELYEISKSLKESQDLRISYEKQKALNEISKQVSHDIRSPLTALNYLIESQKNINLEDLLLIKKSIKRINDIANDLLNESRTNQNEGLNILEPVSLSEFVQEIISEKTLEFKKIDLLSFDLTIDPKALGKKSLVNKKELTRVLSNLINNSVEAMSHLGMVKIALENNNGKNVIIISDTGGGIPENVLAKIGKEEVSTKAKGNGLGLSHAVKAVKSFNGNLIFENGAEGLIVSIYLDALPDMVDAVLIDNDELCRIMWERKAKNKGIKILTCTSPEHFTQIKEKINPQTTIYLDSDLGEGIKGEDFALKLYSEGYRKLIMTTGYSAEKFADYNFLEGVISKMPPF